MGNMKLVLGLLILAIITPYSCASFCVCKSGVDSTAYQKAIDYACGAGADCNPIRPNGQCYNPNSLQSHCSFAANSYFQKNAAKGATCDFQGTATLTNSDPSGGGCSFSASSGSTSTGGTTPVTNVPTTTPTTPTSTPLTPISGGGGTVPLTPVSGSGTPTSGMPTPGTGPTTTSPFTPNVGNPTSTGVLGGNGFGSGLGPTGSSMDDNHGIKLEIIKSWSILVVLMTSGFMCM